MSHKGCCNCLLCKVGGFLGLIDECGPDCCQSETKKSAVGGKAAKKKLSVKKKK